MLFMQISRNDALREFREKMSSTYNMGGLLAGKKGFFYNNVAQMQQEVRISALSQHLRKT